MGKKYDAYDKAAQAEEASRRRLEAEQNNPDQRKAYQAANDYAQQKLISDVTYNEMKEDPKN